MKNMPPIMEYNTSEDSSSILGKFVLFCNCI
jgi:hypothetical protein